jgi:hypothetical protein
VEEIDYNMIMTKNQVKDGDILASVIKKAEMIQKEIESNHKNKMYIILNKKHIKCICPQNFILKRLCIKNMSFKFKLIRNLMQRL